MNATRTLERSDAPTTGTWVIDPGHAEVGFVGRHFGLSKIRGRFTGVDGTVIIGDDVERSSVAVTIDMRTVSSGDQDRDDHLRSDDFFDVERHPTATFTSTAVRASERTITGNLTIKGVTRPVVLTVEYLGQVDDPWGNLRALFSAVGTVNREDWGISWNLPLATGGLLVSKEIRVEIEVELVRQP